MAAGTAKKQPPRSRIRQFVVRLRQSARGEEPELYDRLLNLSLRKSADSGRRVPMTEIARNAIEQHVNREEKKLK